MTRHLWTVALVGPVTVVMVLALPAIINHVATGLGWHPAQTVTLVAMAVPLLVGVVRTTWRLGRFFDWEDRR